MARLKSIRPAHYSEIIAWHSHAWLLAASTRLIITGMKSSPWQRRIQRAEHLANKYSFASEILGFYINIARFQEDLYGRLETESEKAIGSTLYPSGPPELKTLIGSFSPFLVMVEKHAPAPLVAIARELRASSAGILVAVA